MSPRSSRRNAKQLYEQTIRNLNYGEYFDAFDKNLVQLPNGKFAAYDLETYTQMRKDGKIRIGSFDTLIDPETGEPPLLAGARCVNEYMRVESVECMSRPAM